VHIGEAEEEVIVEGPLKEPVVDPLSVPQEQPVGDKPVTVPG